MIAEIVAEINNNYESKARQTRFPKNQILKFQLLFETTNNKKFNFELLNLAITRLKLS